MLVTIINNDTNIYSPANTGTIISETLAILCTPPNIINAVNKLNANSNK